MKDKFKTQKGRLTRYALACGYIEREQGESCHVTMQQASGSLLDVIFYDRETGRRVWAQTTNLPRARRWFLRLRRIVKAKESKNFR